MARLIDADEFMKEIRKWLGNETDFRSLQEIIAGMPTIDTVKHGRVVTTVDKACVYHQNCSECGEEFEWKEYPSYCKGCGAKIDGDPEWPKRGGRMEGE